MDSKNLNESTICCLGDSTTWGDNGNGGGGNDISWTAHLGSLLGGATVENFGVKGSRIAVMSDRSDSFVERLDGIDDKADIYVVFGGVNDFSRNIPLGKMGDTEVHTFYGALDYLVRHISIRTPWSKLVFMTPCKTSGRREKDIPASTETNRLGLTQDAYVKAIFDVCERYAVPVIDLYKESGISPLLPEHRVLYMPDGLHFSPAGYERLAHRIAAGLSAVCC